MFDPTVFDNLKVVMEGGLYDLERQGRLQIVGRQDLLDLATMSRTFSLTFQLTEDDESQATVALSSSLTDFAVELARLRLVEPSPPGCKLQIRYQFENWTGAASRSEYIAGLLRQWWTDEIAVEHLVQSVYRDVDTEHQMQSRYMIVLTFDRKIDEDNMADMQPLLESALASLQELTGYIKP
ncbi:hypothetical protein [Effusibacillus dendaii]|uniref:Group-specific protein n=1 Tax=Effusibacillus dendaii TaxID=2743772 RepID=A0A7I8DAL3_9BACL|nr:hypothetical protein [Effusibacillus dendaii]BCJ87027.1 hypothetical protein skT53_20120 [Effusibacillus dendaii]